MSIEVNINGTYQTVGSYSKDLYNILNAKAEEIVNPAFHVGNLSAEQFTNGGVIAESLQYQLNRKPFGSHGSGVFVTSQLEDVLDWKHNHQRTEDGKQLDNKQLYVVDLDKYNTYRENLLEIKSLEDSDRLGEYFRDLSNIVRLNIKTERNKEDILLKLKKVGIHDIEDFVHKYSDIDIILGNNRMNNLNAIKEWVTDLSGGIDTRIENGADLRTTHNISTLFLKGFGYTGVDLSRVYLDDSVARGSIIFDIDKKAPYEINFGENEDLAIEFFKMIRDKVIERKIPFIEDKTSLKEMLSFYELALPEDDLERVHCISKYMGEYQKTHKQNTKVKNIKRDVER